MNTLQTILALIFIPTSVVGGIVFVLRKFFEQALSRDIEKYKANLQAESERSKLRLQNELQTKFFEFQTKFSLYHQKQAELIGELYGMLSEAEWAVSQLVHPVQFNDGRSQKEKIDETDIKCVELARFYGKNRIYLNEDVCQKMDTILVAMRKAVTRFSVSQMSAPNRAPDIKMWDEAWKVMENEFPPVKKALEQQFRQSLSVFPNNEITHVLESRSK